MSGAGKPQLVWKLSEWPELDRELWEKGLRQGGDAPSYAEDLQPVTIRNAERGYGRFLSVLSVAGQLDPAEMPASRVRPANVRTYIAALQKAGNTSNTIATRFFDLKAALRIMQPEMRFGWLIAPGGIPLRKRLQIRLRPIKVYRAPELRDWGLGLMEQALGLKAPLKRAVLYRNGLLIAILASQAPRQRSVAAMQCWQHIRRDEEGCYRISFEPFEVKNRRLINGYPLPRDLTPWIDHYLARERPVLLAGQRHDWFWVGQKGRRLEQRGIEGVIRRASLARFEEAFGTHRFRHGVATSAAEADPSNPGLAAAVLAISQKVNDEHYKKAEMAKAARRYHRHLQEERQQSRLRARRHFERGD